MSSVVTVYFSEPEPLRIMKDYFIRSLKGGFKELKPLELMRKVRREEEIEVEEIMVVRNVDKLLQGKYSSKEVIPLLRNALRTLGSRSLLMIEVNGLSWSPSDTTKIRIDDVDFPVSRVRVEDTYSMAEELDIDRRRFVIVDI